MSASLARPYKPRGENVMAWIVTPENAARVAAEVGGQIEEDARGSDPTAVAVWLVVPTLAGTQKLLVGAGPVVAREKGTNRLLVWRNREDFLKGFEEVNPDAVYRGK